MPYKDRAKDMEWHRNYMRKRRSGPKMGVTTEKHVDVTPVNWNHGHPPAGSKLVDADGNVIPEY